jgi:hypothetical protein
MTAVQSDEKRVEEPAPLHQRRAAERTKGLADLMVRRPELLGVYKPADVAAESVLWSA